MVILRWMKNGVGYECTFFTLFSVLKALKILRNRYRYIAVTLILTEESDCTFTWQAKKVHDARELQLIEDFKPIL